jgi:hypothetical protein
MNAWWPATGPSDVKESYNLPYYEWYQANKVAQILFWLIVNSSQELNSKHFECTKEMQTYVF